jgi:predicted HicB family RNase H-like nuclease
MPNQKWENIPEVEPDEIDLQMLKETDNENDGEIYTLKDVEEARKNYSGILSLRIPKDLHRTIAVNAEEVQRTMNPPQRTQTLEIEVY